MSSPTSSIALTIQPVDGVVGDAEDASFARQLSWRSKGPGAENIAQEPGRFRESVHWSASSQSPGQVASVPLQL
jgi:hypothetical protein